LPGKLKHVQDFVLFFLSVNIDENGIVNFFLIVKDCEQIEVEESERK